MQIREIKPTVIVAPAFKRVAAYARVSVEKDAALDSLSNQVSYYNDYIGNHPGWLFAGVYADSGISGTKDDRPEFQRMLADARAGKFDMVITKSVTRFARNTVTLLSTVRELKQLGIEVIFEKDGMTSFDADGEMMLSLIAMFAEQEAQSASENKLWQVRKGFEEGIPTYFRMYGYRWVDRHLEIVPEEAEVVRRIFDMYLSGMGKQQIARRLNDDGIPAFHTRWTATAISQVLTNEKYVGDMLLQKYYVPDFRTKKEYRNKGERRQYYVEDSHEPIIGRATFDATQFEIARRRKQSNWSDTPKGKSLFRGLIACGLCGGKYRFKNRRIKSSQSYTPVWICATYLTLGKAQCASKQIRESILIDKTKTVLGLSEMETLTRDILEARIDHIISLPDNKLRYFLKDGRVETVEWQNPSRSKSWTPEMKEKARQKSLEWNKKQNAEQEEL